MSLNEDVYKRNARKAVKGKTSLSELLGTLQKSKSCPVNLEYDFGSDLDE